jgi:cysteine desulfurase / selenocysteine lyase
VPGPPLDRTDFPVTEKWAYLNHAGVTPLPASSVEAMRQAAQATALDGSLADEAHQEMCGRVRADAAHLMGVSTSDVAFVKNTTEGLGFVANGLGLGSGDRVVVPDLEFPSTLYPWLALADLGVVVDRVEPRGPGRALPVEAFTEVIAAGPPPRVVVTSWVQFGRGWRTDLAALAAVTHDAGALLCADVIQGLGVLPCELEAWGVDFAMADGHKWLLGPEGMGLLYVRNDRLDLLRPLEPGWASVAHRAQWDNLDLTWHDTARRLEGGTPNTAGTAALGASLGLLLGAGVDEMWRYVDRLCDEATAKLAAVGANVLSDRSPAGRSGVVTFSVDGTDPTELAASLRRAGVVCSPRGGGIRLSPHGYNTTDEIDALVEATVRATT